MVVLVIIFRIHNLCDKMQSQTNWMSSVLFISSLFYHLHHWIKYLASNHRTRVECLITGSACKYVQIVNITNIELMSHSSVKHLSRFAYAFHILHAQIRFCLHVCTSKRHDILLWMTNLLKFTYISECKQSITFC